MPDSRPPMFDDGGGLPTVARNQSTGQHAGGTDHRDDYNDRPGPNYLVRRAIAVGAGVAVIAVLAVGVGKLLDRGGGSDSAFSQPDWNTIVSVDDSSGVVVLTDNNGDEKDRIRLGIRQLTATHVVGDHIVAANDTSVVLTSLSETSSTETSSPGAASSGSETTTTVDIESTGALLLPSGSTQTVIAHNETSERAVFINASSGDIIDTDAVDTVAGAKYDLDNARSDPSGRNVLVADVRTGQSVLFSFDHDQPSFFPGLPLAIDEARVVTAQNVGTDATITVFDAAGEPGVSARTTSVRAGMLAGDNIVMVTVNGEIRVMSAVTGEIVDAGPLNVGTVNRGHVAVRGDRLIVVGSTGTAIVDAVGATVAEVVDAAPTKTGIDSTAPHRSECLILERGREVVVVSLEDGAVVVEAIATGEVRAGVNGCAPVVSTATGYLAISTNGVVRATVEGDVAAVSPDGSTIVVENGTRLELLPRADGGDESDAVEPVDIGRTGRTTLFADL